MSGTGGELLTQLLAFRQANWRGRGSYRPPRVPETDSLQALPEGWTWASVEQLSSPEANSLCIGPFGSNLKVADYRDSGIPLVFVRNIRAEDFTLDQKFISPEKADELDAHSAAAGDLLVTKMGDPPGDVTIYPTGAPKAIVTADCIKWRLSPGLDTPKFFVYAIRSEVVQRQILDRTRGVAQKKLSLDRFREVAIPLPPRGQQQAIVSRIEELFSRLDAGEAALRAAKAKLQRYRQSVLTAAVTGELTREWRDENPDVETGAEVQGRRLTQRREHPNGTENRPEGRTVPQSWIYASFGQVTTNYDGKRIPLKRSDRNQRTGSYPYYGASGIIDQIDDYLFDGRYLLVSEDGANLLARSTPIAFQARGKFWVNNHAHVIQTVEGILLEYVEIYVNGLDLSRFVTGTAQPKLTQASLNRIPVPIPPLEEQRLIVAEVERRLSSAIHLDTELDRRIAGCVTLRQAALSQAFSGALC